MLQKQENLPVSITASELSLPPLLNLNPSKRLPPPPSLLATLGPIIAHFVHNYQQTGPIYRYLDLYSNKVKTVISGLEANVFAMRQAKTLFTARSYRQKQTAELGSEKYIVAMDGQAHYQMRKLQKPGYARSTLEGRDEMLIEVVHRALADHPPDDPLPAYRFFQKVTAIQLGQTILNVDISRSWSQICFFVDGMLDRSFPPSTLAGERLDAYRDAKGETMALADEMVDFHQTVSPSPPRPDLVDDLLDAVDQDERLLNEQELRIAALTPFIAGVNPVAHTCSFLLYALLTHPQMLEPVLSEINEVIGREGLSLKSVRKMEKLRTSLLEALRLYPFAPVLEMTAREPFEFNGFRVKSQTAVVLATTVPHFLEEHFANPLEFNIHRFGSDQVGYKQPGVFVPYGVGPHICLGAGFAEDQMLLTMAALLGRASITLKSNTPKPVVGMPGTVNFPMFVS